LSGVSYPIFPAPQAVVTADVNGDGKLDLITASAPYDSTLGRYAGGGVSVLLAQAAQTGKKGAATSSFGTATNYAVGTAFSLAVGDFNGDRKLDIVTGSGAVLLGNGDGTFRVGASYTGGLGTYVAAVDVNGDGRLDLITADVFGITKMIQVLPGHGDGTFGVGATYTMPTYVDAVVVGDFNGDGKLDLVADCGATVYLLPGNGDGTFGSLQTVATIPGAAEGLAMTTADFNGDGKLDVALTFIVSNTAGGPSTPVDILLGNGDGTFTTSGNGFGINPSGSTGPFPSAGLVAADINHDGKLDLVTVGVEGAGTTVGVLYGNGDGTFTSYQEFFTATGSVGTPTAIAVADFNGDGLADFAVVGSSWNGDGEIEVFLRSSTSKK
jgi:hypothetical protein